MECIYHSDWQGVGELMLSSANKLANIGADFLICPDNTMHQALPYVEPLSPLPWLHIAEVVAAQAVERGFRRLALTGTRLLVESEIYPEKLTAPGPGISSDAAASKTVNFGGDWRMNQILSSLIAAIVVSFPTAWITAHLALRRFYSEKLWERKVAAYTTIFEALHDMRQWFEEHINAFERGRDVADERSKELLANYNQAKRALARRLDAETWLLSEACQSRLLKMNKELDKPTTADTWYDHCDSGYGALASALKDIRVLVRSDLKLKRYRGSLGSE
jgi:hypothetical protein